MYGKHVDKKLSAYCHGELSTEESRHVAEHVLACQRCRRELEEIKLGINLAERLPQASAPASLWNEIEASLEQSARSSLQSSKQELSHGSSPSWLNAFRLNPARLTAFASIALAALFIGGIWFYHTRSVKTSWDVASLDGAPRIESERFGVSGKLAVGEWLETDGASRAQISVGEIGKVDIEPNTRVRLIETEATNHRLSLTRGKMHATIWAPPRLFYVDTPSAEAIDLGCSYTLEVDDAGASFLRVTAGWVELDLHGRKAIVPAGAMCVSRPGTGPGTPYFEDATETFRIELAHFDFDKNDDAAQSRSLTVLLAEARSRDALTLWHLLTRTKDDARSHVYQRLAELAPPPAGVTREGVLRLEQKMLESWREELPS
jgi:hypothetical protein